MIEKNRQCRSTFPATRSAVRSVSADYSGSSIDDDLEDPEICPVVPWKIETPSGN